MWKQLLSINLSALGHQPLPPARKVELVHEAGFDAFFIDWKPDFDVAACTARARALGLRLFCMHAPFGKAAALWGAAAAKTALDEQLACLADCQRHEIPIMVVHAFCGFDDHEPTPEGLERFGVLVDAAEQAGVKVAVENTEGEEYLDAILTHFADRRNVGFCWDTGHELCYNHARDMLGAYGDRIFCTHLNDNLGIRDYKGAIAWQDDLHLLPFDGIADWDDIVARLDRCGYGGFLTFEINPKSRPGRHKNDAYTRMDPAEWMAECYKRACRVAAKRQLRRD